MRLVVKGAPEYILPMCTSQVNAEGENEQLIQGENDRILEEEVFEKFAKQGLRTIAFAYKDISNDEWEELKSEHNNFVTEEDRAKLEQRLHFVAVFGLNDELRPGVDQAIRKLFEGQINVRMISGDNLSTAIICAQRAGILNEGEENLDKVCMLGSDFREQVGGVRQVTDQTGKTKFEVVNK